jgi:hypothetical protein
MWSNRRTLGWQYWIVGLVLIVGCSGKTVNNGATGNVDTSLEAGVDAALTTSTPEAGGLPSAPSDSVSVETAEVSISATSSTTGAPTTTTATAPNPTTVEPLSSETASETTTTTGFWTCFTSQYGDGVCDCGCGIQDIDCAATGNVDLCERCSSGCNASQCPGRIDPDDTTQCVRISPPEWDCNDSWYSDGSTCHCGCGVPDPDCASGGVESCDVCNVQGSCGSAACPSSINPEDNSKCWVPDDWTCFEGYFGDGLCNCGCGALDSDCSSLSRDACLSCIGCNYEGCPGTIDEVDNRICTGPPYVWSCDDRYYDDGQLCNCGCGYPDPDCENDGIDACDVCDFTGSCSKQDCPGTIDPTNNAYCEQPAPPPEWTCDPARYGDGYACDCGCGVEDLDCATDDIAACHTCCNGYTCPFRVNPEDTTECLPVPEEWVCPEWSFGDNYTCDCGCGVRDPDCEDATSDVCDSCPYDYGYGAGGCSRNGSCDTIVADDNAHCIDDAPPNWTCDELYYADGDACDCGCGAIDLDCQGNTTLAACDICNTEGSCSPTGCNNSPAINPTNNAICGDDEPVTSEPVTSHSVTSEPASSSP